MRVYVRLIPVALVTAALMLGGCKKSKPNSKKDESAETMAPSKLVTVPKAGRKFAPPIKPEQLPPGVWYCDMGTVEYARIDKGDGTCPICKMKLKQKLEAKK